MESQHTDAIHRRKQYIEIALKRAKSGSGSAQGFVKARTLKCSVTKIRKIIKNTPFLIAGDLATRLYMPERMKLDLDILVSIKDAAKVEDELIQKVVKNRRT